MSKDKPIGYKSPPKWAQFKPGTSGNPAGRPRKSRHATNEAAAPSDSAVDDVLRRQLAAPVTITTRQGTQQVAALEAAVMALSKNALHGGILAQRDMIKLATMLEQRDSLRQLAEVQEERDTYDWMLQFRKERRQIWDAANKAGREPDNPWPHPDDILINSETEKWKIRGPRHGGELPYFEHLRAERDWYFGHMIRAVRRARTGIAKDRQMERHAFWHCFNMLLPLRWQLLDEGLDLMIMLFMDMPMRDLDALVRTYAGRRDRLAPPPPTGHTKREIYKEVNAMMKPLLAPYGYRSLAQFEHDYETHGEAMPLVPVEKGGSHARSR